MLVQRKAWELLLIQPCGNGMLTICNSKDNGQLPCYTKESGYTFLFIPYAIEWSGHFSPRDHTIHWTNSSIRIGWKSFGKTFLKLKNAEKRRKDPWVVYYPQGDESHGEILILHRKGSGKLVYAKKETLMK